MKLLLGVTGSVAAKLTPKLVRTLMERVPELELKVIATDRALYFFRKEDVPIPVLTDKSEWTEGGYVKDTPVLHIDLGEWADQLLIAPLSADTLSDMAHGKANKFLTSTVLAWPREKRIILAPAMNTRMWSNPITQDNLATIQRVYNTGTIEPVEGMLACKTKGVGAMAHIDTIVASLLPKKVH
ncbi:MAG: flavoprotein [Candidatus Paceibacterota bacterium]|jgi:phosphopantothenoylcysteine synthetase/decarboxylase